MQITNLDSDNYLFWDQDVKKYRYRHKFLVPGTEKGDYGMFEKWSDWTELDARLYAKKHNVNIIHTSKKPI